MGKGCGTTDRDLESDYNKTSVLKIITDDNIFWYAMVCLMIPENKSAKDNGSPNTRIRLGRELCNKARCDWDNHVPLLQVPLVEEKLNCHTYMLGVYNIPMLGSAVSLLLGDVVM